jgi:hypothetical protein
MRAIFALAALLYVWNAARVAPLSGYDAAGHAAYALTLLEEWRLPNPVEGWSTFHPPAYYVLLAGLWRAFAWAGPAGQLWVGNLLSAAAIFTSAGVLSRILRERGTAPSIAVVAVAVALFLPAAQLAGTMLGNEALGVAFASLALPGLLRLQRDPTDRRSAIDASVFAGLALATKFTGLFVASALLVPFFRRGLPSSAYRCGALAALVVAAISGPIYLRNWMLTGSAIPMTRQSDHVAAAEATFVLRERRLGDYLGFPIATLRRPSIVWQSGEAPAGTARSLNPTHVHVWGNAYASTWFDAYASRLPLRAHRDGVYWGPLLSLLGLAPTLSLLHGCAIALRNFQRAGGRDRDAPLLAMGAVGLSAFVGFTAANPALVASKGSYLLPLLVPAGIFFARGAAALPASLRRAVLCVASSAVVTSAVLFTVDAVYESRPLPPKALLLRQAEQARVPHVYEALERFLPPRRE